jgi:hypothetical protein
MNFAANPDQMISLPNPRMTFKFILEDNWTSKMTFVTVENCIDMDDAINHIHSEFPSHTIDNIKEVK